MAIGPVGSDVKTVGAASQLFDTTMVAGVQYLVFVEAAAWIKVTTGAGSAAADTDGNVFIPAGKYFPVAVDGANTRVAIIQDAAGGQGVLIQMSLGSDGIGGF